MELTQPVDHPGDVHGNLALGQFYLRTGIIDRALAHAQAAQVRAAGNADVARLLGLIFLREKRYAEAITKFREAVEASPRGLSLHILLGRAYSLGGRRAEALEALTKASEQFPASPRPHSEIGMLLCQTEDYDKASVAFRKVLEIAPGNPQGMNNLAHVLLELGQDLAEAQELAGKASAAKPTAPVFRDTFAWTHYLQGNYERTVEVLTKNGMVTPQLPVSLYHLACAYEKLDRLQEAKNVLLRVQEAAPKHPHAKKVADLLQDVAARLGE